MVLNRSSSKAKASSSSFNIPEEIIEHILLLVFFPSGSPLQSETCTSPRVPVSPTSVLLVCKTFERIAKPLLYRSLHLRNRIQADKLAATMCRQPKLGAAVQVLRVEGPIVGHAFGLVLKAIKPYTDRSAYPLRLLDVKLDGSQDQVPTRDDFACFCQALAHIPNAERLSVRKSGYLTHEWTLRAVVDLASGIRSMNALEYVDLMYKPSPLPPAMLCNSVGGSKSDKLALDPLASALLCSPYLKVIRAQTPAVWNTFLLQVSGNTSLMRIELSDRDETMLAAIPVMKSTSCEGRYHCRGRGRGMSDVVAPMSVMSRKPFPIASSSLQYQTSKVTCVYPDDELIGDSELAEVVTLPPSLFMSQAAKHHRLYALLLAGRREAFLARMQERAERARIGVASGCLCVGERMSTSLTHTLGTVPPPAQMGFGSRTRAHTVLPSASASVRTGRK